MVKKSVLLRCSKAHAFALFTQEMSLWWPETRRHTKDPASRITMLPSGRFWEQSGDRSVELGRVRVWDAPDRLVLDFYPGTDADHPTEVTVTFTVEGEGTRVGIDHRPTAASEELWTQRAPAFEKSWDAVLAALEEAAEQGLASR